jgi:uncharacterized RDD family membrane protein YckC
MPPVEARVAAGAGGVAPEAAAPLEPAPAPRAHAPELARGAAPAAGPAAVHPFVSPSARPPLARLARVAPTDPLDVVPARGRRAEQTRPRPAAGPGLGGFLPRAGAAALDLVLVTTVQALVVAPAVFHWRARAPGSDPTFMGVLLAVAGAAVAGIFGIAYYVYYWGLRGATPGKRLLRLTVQGEDGSEPIGPTRAAVRLFGCLVSAALLGAGFIMVAFGGRGLHDRIAGTRVVRRERG